MRKSKSLIGLTILYVVSLLLLVVYSYSQIDLNLTLSSNSIYQSIQQKLIFLGYFNRPLSTTLFIILLLILFSTQIGFLYFAKKKVLQTKTVWKLALISSIILLFAYPAFSHDIFNYIFDTRMLVTHKVNPYQFTALDFPNDLWTRFMRWTHRTYPYGPIWIFLTIPFYLAGLGKFTLILLWYKAIGVISYLTSLYFLKKIAQKFFPKQTSFSLTLFAFSPLILIEGLVTAHLDIAMAAFLLASIYFSTSKKKIKSWFTLLISGGIKFLTFAAIPVWLWWKGEEDKFPSAITATLLLTLMATAAVVISRELLPWYFITPLAIAALLPKSKELIYVGIIFSFGLLLRYAPYLLKGDYSDWVKSTRNLLTLIPIIIYISWIIWRRKKKFSSFFS